MAERIGFVGLELMGRPMAYHVLKAGYQLSVYNRSWAAVDELARAGKRESRSFCASDRG